MSMGNAVRVGDMASGHGCYPPQKMATGSGNVYVNMRSVCRKGDELEYHLCVPGEKAHNANVRVIDNRTHYPRTYADKPEHEQYTVWINGIPPAKLKDKFEFAKLITGELIDPPRYLRQGEDSFCEGIIITASKNVFFEDGK